MIAMAIANVTAEEKMLCTAVEVLMSKWTSRGIAGNFGLSEHTIRSLVCGRRRPGSKVLGALEHGAVHRLQRIAGGDTSAGDREHWWRFLDTVLRTRLCEIAEPAAQLHARLTQELKDGAIPEGLFDLLEKNWHAFERGNRSREFLEAVAHEYRNEAAELLLRHPDAALCCRQIALLAERVLAELNS